MTKKTAPVVFKVHCDFALNNELRNKSISEKKAVKYVKGMFDYLCNLKKKAINMYDYFQGKINHDVESNLVLENGKYATIKDIKKRKEKTIKYFENSNIWKCIISFSDNDFVTSSIKLEDLEQRIIKDVLPKFFKRVGFKDINKMSYMIALHTNTDHYHFHLSFMEKEPNFIYGNNKVGYRKKGKIDLKDCNFLKNEVLHILQRERLYSNLVIKSNKEIDELKKFFNPKEKNFILKHPENYILENNILKLGKLLYEERNDKNTKIKYNSIKNQEIKNLTKEIRNYLFHDKKSAFYKKNKEFNETIKNINNYFYELNKQNNIKNNKNINDYGNYKKEYLNNYIFNAIVNCAYFRYKKLKKDKNYISTNDIIKEIVKKQYKTNYNVTRKDILLNYLDNTVNRNKYKQKYQIENSIKKINEEMKEAEKQFEELFKNNEINNNNIY